MKLSRGAERPRRYAGIIFLLILVVSAGFAVSAFAAGGGEGGSKGWVSADWARVLNFAVLVLLLFVVLRKPLPKMLNNRIDGIRAELSELEAQKAEAEQKLAGYNEKLSALEDEADKIVQQYVKQGNEAKARILKEAEASAEKLQQQARRAIEHEFEQAKSKLQADVLEKSLKKAEEMISSQINESDQGQLIDEYLEKVVS
jgi:F-type H+-transporting ATPase subunit b